MEAVLANEDDFEKSAHEAEPTVLDDVIDIPALSAQLDDKEFTE